MYFRVKAKAKSKSHYREVNGIILSLAAFMTGYCLILPSQAGVIGEAVHNILSLVFGRASCVLPFILLWCGWVHLRSSYQLRSRLDTIWGVLMLLSASSFLDLAGLTFFKNVPPVDPKAAVSTQYGGWMGDMLSPLFTKLVGNSLGLLFSFLLFVFFTCQLLRISLKDLFVIIAGKLREDFEQWHEEWSREREEARERKALQEKEQPKIKKRSEDVEKQLPKSEPKIVTPPVQLPLPSITPPIKVAAETKKDKPAKDAPKSAEKPAPLPANFEYKLPSLEFLSNDKQKGDAQSREEHLSNAELLTKTLSDFNITAKVKEIIPGPVVTRYDIELAPGIKIQSVVALSDNIGLAMRSPSIRVVPIPEKAAVGIEVPNATSCMVGLRGIMAGPDFQNSKSLLSLALGKTTDGFPSVANLASMPHLLIAGATGSGKSVGIHSIILSILYKARPDEVKFMLIDPKRVEMPVYRDIPHIYDPSVPAEKADIITQPKEASASLKKLVRVMEMRYEKFASVMVRNIEGYNEKMAETGGQKEFYIVVIIDELADLMMVASKDIEDSIQRLAQMARAVGIHLILATQRPSVDVITGVIKSNFPARIAFQTTSKVDSRVILDAVGAENLLGRGDMLFLPPGEARPMRLQGAFVSVKEAESVVGFIKSQGIPPQYDDLFARPEGSPDMSGADEFMEELFEACNLVLERKRVSQDLLKAHFGSSARATNILSMLEMKGFIFKPEGTNRWTIYFDKITDYLNTMNNIVNKEQ